MRSMFFLTLRSDRMCRRRSAGRAQQAAHRRIPARLRGLVILRLHCAFWFMIPAISVVGDLRRRRVQPVRLLHLRAAHQRS